MSSVNATHTLPLWGGCLTLWMSAQCAMDAGLLQTASLDCISVILFSKHSACDCCWGKPTPVCLAACTAGGSSHSGQSAGQGAPRRRGWGQAPPRPHSPEGHRRSAGGAAPCDHRGRPVCTAPAQQCSCAGEAVLCKANSCLWVCSCGLTAR